MIGYSFFYICKDDIIAEIIGKTLGYNCAVPEFITDEGEAEIGEWGKIVLKENTFYHITPEGTKYNLHKRSMDYLWWLINRVESVERI